MLLEIAHVKTDCENLTRTEDHNYNAVPNCRFIYLVSLPTRPQEPMQSAHVLPKRLWPGYLVRGQDRFGGF